MFNYVLYEDTVMFVVTSTVYQTTIPPGAVNVSDPVKTPPKGGQMDSVYSASCLGGTVSPGLPLTPGRSLSTANSMSFENNGRLGFGDDRGG